RVIPGILRTICERLEWDCGNVWTVDADRATLRHTAEWHRPQDCLGGSGQTAASLTFRPGVGMAGRVWSERRPIWVPDLAVEKNVSRTELASDFSLRSARGCTIRRRWAGRGAAAAGPSVARQYRPEPGGSVHESCGGAGVPRGARRAGAERSG